VGGPSSGGRSAIALPQSRSPCSHFPQPFCGVSGAPLHDVSIDQWGPGIGWEQHWGPAGDRPPPRAPAGDPTAIMPVKGTYSGDIESLNRDPGLVTLDPGMHFSGN